MPSFCNIFFYNIILKCLIASEYFVIILKTISLISHFLLFYDIQYIINSLFIMSNVRYVFQLKVVIIAYSKVQIYMHFKYFFYLITK
jgi:hypothetical protein